MEGRVTNTRLSMVATAELGKAVAKKNSRLRKKTKADVLFNNDYDV
jgi:hypothetical protein